MSMLRIVLCSQVAVVAGQVCGTKCASDADCAVQMSNCTWCLPHPNPNEGTTCSPKPTTCGGSPPPPAKTGLPQMYMLGDSVTHGLAEVGHVPEAMLKVGIEAIPVDAGGGGQCGPTSRGLECLRAWVGTNQTRFDIVSFQFGLHDLGTATWGGAPVVPLQQYSANLRNISRFLQRRFPSAKLLFITTTPVPASHALVPPRLEADVVKYNTAAKMAMQAEGIPVLDMWAFVDNMCGGDPYQQCPAGCADAAGGESKNCFQRKDNVHFWPGGYTQMTQPLVATAKRMQFGGACPASISNITVGVC